MSLTNRTKPRIPAHAKAQPGDVLQQLFGRDILLEYLGLKRAAVVIEATCLRIARNGQIPVDDDNNFAKVVDILARVCKLLSFILPHSAPPSPHQSLPMPIGLLKSEDPQRQFRAQALVRLGTRLEAGPVFLHLAIGVLVRDGGSHHCRG